MRIAALLACHNRREKTIACLRSLKAQDIPSGTTIDVFLVDDGSSDGTTAAVIREWPDATILVGNGSLYWCGGMRLAWTVAAKADPDFYLLLNDDTVLLPGAIEILLKIAGDPGSAQIAVGAVRDPEAGKQIYGGHRRPNILVKADGKIHACDTFNANCAIIPRAVHRVLGILHPTYTHSMGDYDYGFSATRKGIPILQAPNIIGTCTENPIHKTWRDRSLPRLQRLHLLQSHKGLPWREWLTYTRRNEGVRWPLKFLGPIVRILIGR